jgi:hypothetical protein
MHSNKAFRTFLAISATMLVLATAWVRAQAPAAHAGAFNRRGAAEPYNYDDNTGFVSMFDGKTLNGWDYDPRFWSVKDGAIYVNPTCEKPTGTIYAIWQGGDASDFILKYELKGTQAVNSGVQFRSYLTADQNVDLRYPPHPRPAGAPGSGSGGPGHHTGPGAAGGPGGGGHGRPSACANPGTRPTAEEEARWDMNGPQADYNATNDYSAMFYEQGGRGIIALPGHVLYSEHGKPVADLATLADRATLDSWFKKNDYNQFTVLAKGNSVSIFMNGHLITQFIDTDPTYFRSSGKIGIEVESTGELWARNFYIKKLSN